MTTRKTLTDDECREKMQAVLAGLDEKMDKLIETVHGNGKPGLVQQAAMNTAHRERMEQLIDGLWLKVLLIWVSSMGTIAALINFLQGR